MFLQSSFVLRTLAHNGNTAPFYRGGVSYAINENEKGRFAPLASAEKEGRAAETATRG